MAKIKYIDELRDLKGKRVILRVDLNVRIESNLVKEDYRIKRILPTIDYLISQNAKVILISHIDKKEGGSLEPVAKYLVLKYPRLRFVPELESSKLKSEIENLTLGGIILMENIRNYEGEEANDEKFASFLAGLGDIYVNDAFAVSHRNHTSIVSLPKLLPAYAGFLMREEIENLSRAFNPAHPFLLILGGAKIETKLPLISKFLPKADGIFVGGALANDIFKFQGFFVGDSLVSPTLPDLQDIISSPKIVIPSDIVATYKGTPAKKSPQEVGVGEKIVDIGEKSLAELQSLIKNAKFIVWNGPLGKNEYGFGATTIETAKAVSESNAISIIGGGDTLSAIEEINIFQKFSFVSTGGGAMLDFLSNGTLPGLEALGEVVLTSKKEKINWLKKIFS